MHRFEYKQEGIQEGLQDAYDEIKREAASHLNGGFDPNDPLLRGFGASLDAILRKAREHDVKIVKGHMNAPTIRIDDINY